MKKAMRILGAVLMLVAMIPNMTGCYLFPEEEAELAPPLVETQAVQYKTTEVTKGTIVDKVTVSATFMAYLQESVFFKVDGRIGEVVVKIGDNVKAGDLLIKLDVEDIEKQVRNQKLVVEKQRLYYNDANKAYKQWQEDYGWHDDAEYPNMTALKAARIDLEMQENYLKDYEAKLEGAYIYAPFDGIVSWAADVQAGDYVSAYDDLLTISDPTQLMLRTSDAAAQRLVLGQQVTLTYDGKEYTSTVISTPANAPEEMATATNLVFFDVVEGLSYPNVGLGSTANVTGIIAERNDTIVVMKAHVKSYYGRDYVNVLNAEGLKEERNIEIGLATSTQVEILDGLEVGELIIVS